MVENKFLTALVDRLRDDEIKGYHFKEIVSEIAKFLLYEALSDYDFGRKEVKHWLGTYDALYLDSSRFAIVPILRASLGMTEGINQLLKEAKIYHLGMFRDPETHEPIWYYNRLPESLKDLDIIIPDPMLATGGSIIEAIKEVKKRECRDIYILSIISAPEGIDRIKKEYPDVKIYAASVDDHLDGNKYIIPGLGDAGDRLNNT